MKRLLCALLTFAGLVQPALAGPSRPNLLVILADDLGRGDYSAFGTKDIRTPNIDRLCREGMTFENFYANSCACSPSRAALLSGCYPDRVGVPGLVRHTLDGNWGCLSAKATLLPKALKAADYHSAIVGKWNLGLEPPNTPNDRGFDLFHGFLGDMMDDYWTHLRAGQNFLRLNREVIEPKGHATDLFTDWACSYLEERAKADGPFFLYLAYTAPHDPIQPPPEWLAKVQKRQPGLDEKRAKIVALIEHLDFGIGKVLDALDRLKLAENTLIVLTSDNGGNLIFGANNGPWRSGKTHMYEGGLRVPGVARWPARIRRGSRTAHMALSMDIYATFCETAGVAPPEDIDGVSFLPTLLGKRQPEPRGNRYFVLREGGPIFGGKTSNALIEGPWKLLQDRPGLPLELYNLQADPQETTDLAAKEQQKLLALDTAMRRHIQQGGQVPWEPEDPAAAFPPPNSLTSPHLKKWLEKFPAADLNHDGILTAEEVWEFQSPKYRAAQIQKLQQLRKALLAKLAPQAGTARPAPKAPPGPAPQRPKPDYENVRYGPYERNVLDLWLAKSDRPTPLVVHIHGGGWMAGDKSQIHPLVVAECLKSGISVASINYRYTTTAPLPAPHLDGARAIQFLRSKARQWNLDPARVAAYGGSAGAGITLWLAFKRDMADPGSADPVARQSTRLCCGATFGGQCTYDPHVIRRWIGEQAARHPVFNTAYHVKSYEDLDNPKLQPIYDEVSAIKHLTAEAAPIFEVYSEANVPLTPNAQIGQGMHHPIFGLKLKEAMDRLGVECVYLHTVEFSGDPNLEMLKFFRKHLGVE